MSADPAGSSSVAAEVAETPTPAEADAASAQRHLHPVPNPDQNEGSAQRTDAPEATEPAEDEATEVTSEPENPEADPGVADPDAAAALSDTDETTRLSWVSRLDLSALLTWSRDTFTPQSGLWSQRPAAPDEVLDRARRGSQVAAVGPLRTLSIADGYAAAAVKVLLRCGDWLLEHPARRLVAAVLLAVALVYPPTRVAIGYALTPIAALADLLT